MGGVWGTGAAIIYCTLYTITKGAIRRASSRALTKKQIPIIFYIHPYPGGPKITLGFGLWPPLYMEATTDLSRFRFGATCKRPFYLCFCMCFCIRFPIQKPCNCQILRSGVDNCVARICSANYKSHGLPNYATHEVEGPTHDNNTPTPDPHCIAL